MEIVIPNATSIGVFAVAAMLLLLTPGPAVLYIVSRSVEQGRIAGVASVCVSPRNSVHVLRRARLSRCWPPQRSPSRQSNMRRRLSDLYRVRRILSRTDMLAAQLELPRRSWRASIRRFRRNLLNPRRRCSSWRSAAIRRSLACAVAFQIAFLGLLFTLMG